MRTEKELMQVMLENINMLFTGLCGLNFDMRKKGIISGQEMKKIRKYLNENLPFRSDSDFCWLPFQEAPRIEWLKKQIKKLETKK